MRARERRQRWTTGRRILRCGAAEGRADVSAVTSISGSDAIFWPVAPQPGPCCTPRSPLPRRRLPLHGGELHEDPRSALLPQLRCEENLGGAPHAQFAGGWEED
jgi:hypothetical protein